MDPLWFGTAIREITPSYPVWLYGYADRNHRSDGVADPIYLGCMAVGDGQNTALLVTCDLVGIQSHVCDRLYELLERETGITYPYVMLACSHTHFAPALHSGAYSSPQPGIVEPEPRFVADFEAKLLEAARESLRNMQPGRLETARLDIPQVVFNRRTVRQDGSVQTNFMYPSEPDAYTFGPIDTEMTVLRVRDEDRVKAVLVNYGCHPVTGGETRERDHLKISGDYVTYLRRTVLDRYACPVFFTLGAAGDAVPINRYGDCRRRIGSVLGNAVILAERTYVVDETTEIRADYLTLEVTTIVETDPGIAETEFEQARAAFCSLQGQPDVSPDSQAYGAAADAYQRKTAALLRSRLYPDNRYVVRVQFLQIGKTLWVGLPFEVLSEIALGMKARYPDSVLVSCAGGYQGYLPLAYEYERGGYEATESSTHLQPGTADRALDAILDKLAEWTAPTDRGGKQ